jgi:potassium efflux system protein
VQLRRFLTAALAALWFATAALAYDQAIVGQAEQSAATLTLELRTLDASVNSPRVSDDDLSKYRGQAESIRTKAAAVITTLAGPINEVTQQITGLGPVLTDGSKEPPPVVEQRKRLNDELNRLLGPKSQLDLIVVGAEQLSGRISAIQRDQFVKRIFQQERSILNPVLWLDMGVGMATLIDGVTGVLSDWWAEVSRSANFLGLGLIPVFLVAFAGVYALLRSRFGRWADLQRAASRSPDDIGRLWRVVRGAIGAVFVLIIIFAPIYLALDIAGFMSPSFALIFDPFISIVVSTTLYWTTARRLAAPGQPNWRIVDLDETAASRLPILVGLAGFVSVITKALRTIADGLYLPVSYTVGQSALSAIILLLLLALILLALRKQQGIQGKPPGRQVYFNWSAAFAPILWLLIVVGITALATGYIAFANFIALQAFETAVLVTVLFLGHYLTDAAVAASFDPQSGFGGFLRRYTRLGERAIERVGIMARTIVDLLLVAIGLPLLFINWTVTWVDFRSLLNSAVLGFRIGDVVISPTTIALVLLVLAAGIGLTNLAVRWLDRRVLTHTRIDKGVQDSVRKGASYAGYVVAFGVAFSAAGIDFSNLAIIAGALGVGIGFGLQSIVNNFVSGLILLAERPIRVGDWVALDAGEGLVKKINVRATEIETFDSCSIIVPNSSLITGAVRNWTHGDTMGRFTVSVTVTHDSDPNKVRDILTEIVRSHPKVLTYPQPMVLFQRIGIVGLDFEIKANVADIFYGVIVASEIRYTIMAAFAENAISIPPPSALLLAGKT